MGGSPRRRRTVTYAPAERNAPHKPHQNRRGIQAAAAEEDGRTGHQQDAQHAPPHQQGLLQAQVLAEHERRDERGDDRVHEVDHRGVGQRQVHDGEVEARQGAEAQHPAQDEDHGLVSAKPAPVPDQADPREHRHDDRAGEDDLEEGHAPPRQLGQRGHEREEERAHRHGLQARRHHGEGGSDPRPGDLGQFRLLVQRSPGRSDLPPGSGPPRPCPRRPIRRTCTPRPDGAAASG